MIDILYRRILMKLILTVFASLLFICFYVESVNASESTTVINRKVFLLIFNPQMSESQNILQKYNWNNPDNITQEIIEFFKETSGNRLNFSVAKRVEVKDFTTLVDGYKYNPQTFHECILDHSKCHDPQGSDYEKIVEDYNICSLLNKGEIDELWMWGGPYFGFYESQLVGPNVYWYNGPGIENSQCKRLIPIMGFSYERYLGEAIEDFGHRTESTFAYLYPGSGQNSMANFWTKFAMNDFQSPSYDFSGCGSVHFAPNSTSDYDWGNKSYVPSYCHQYLTTINPDISKTKSINCDAWGCTGLGYFKYWYEHIPSFSETSNGKYHDWWRYIADPNTVFVNACTPSCTDAKCGAADGCGGKCSGTCTEVPKDFCLDESTVRDYKDKGVCSSSTYKCNFEYEDTTCNNGCFDGKCKECIPSCENRCGQSDGCGGTCGACEENNQEIEGENIVETKEDVPNWKTVLNIVIPSILSLLNIGYMIFSMIKILSLYREKPAFKETTQKS